MVDLKKIGIILLTILSIPSAYSDDGIIDRSFGMGQSHENIPVCKAVAVQKDGKVLITGHLEVHGKKTFAVARLHPNGLLDQSFGKNGVCSTHFTNGETASGAHAVMIDSADRIVVAGFTNGINNVCHACLARYQPDGSLDKSFFGGRAAFKGTVITCFGSLDEISRINALVETDDQKIIAVGTTYENGVARFAIARYNLNGALDTHFNARAQGSMCGTVCTQFDSSTNDQAFAVALDACGKIVVAGSSYASGVKTFALARYHKDGSLDQSFYGGNSPMHGGVITNFLGGETEGQAHAICIQADGKIVVGGYTNAYCHEKNATHFALARYTAQGLLDKDFGVDAGSMPGTLVTGFGENKTRSAINALLLQTDNKIVAGGYAELNGIRYFALARYEQDGTCDYTFNGGQTLSGKVLTRCSNQSSDEIFGLAMMSPGDIIAVGRSKKASVQHGAVARYVCDQEIFDPEISNLRDAQKIVDGSNILVNGIAHATSQISLYLDEKKLDTIYVRDQNKWHYRLPALIDGNHTLKVVERYQNGNLILESKKITVLVDQHPVAFDQTIVCHGMRPTKGVLTARGASENYVYKIIKETNCKVTLEDNSSIFVVSAIIPSGNAGFDFEVTDKITACAARGSINLLVREIPEIKEIKLCGHQQQKIEESLSSYVSGGTKPYEFELSHDSQAGNYEITAEDKLTFSSSENFVGIAECKIKVNDSYQVQSDWANILVQIYPVPKAFNATFNSYSDQQVVGQLQPYAYDGLEPYQFSANNYANNCSVTVQQDGSFVCIPENNSSGFCSFEYIITDARGYQSKGNRVTINLHQPMILKEGHFIVVENKTVEEDLSKLIVKGAPPYSFYLEAQNENGFASLTEAGILEFIPNKDFTGKAEFEIRVRDANAYEGLYQKIKVVLNFKQMSDFETVLVNLYEDVREGDLNNFSPKKHIGIFELKHSSEGLNVELKRDGTFNFEIDDNCKEPIGFMYVIKDQQGNSSDLMHAQIVLHKYPISNSMSMQIENGQIISGNLNDFTNYGFRPLHYQILSARNGKITSTPDGSYTFVPKFNSKGTAEFTYKAIDSNNSVSNISTIQFSWPCNAANADHGAEENLIYSIDEKNAEKL